MSSLGLNMTSLSQILDDINPRTAALTLTLAVPGAVFLLYHLTPSYTARMTAYYAALTGVSTVLMPVSLFPRPRRPENMLRCAHVMNALSRYLLGWRFQVRALNLPRMREDRAYVIVIIGV